MAEPLQVTPTPRAKGAAVRLAQVAERQWGVVTRAQIEHAGVSGSALSRWVRDGRLHRLDRGVYAVGHRSLSVEGRLLAALFYAGPGAMLSHVTAAWWWKLLAADEPARIHLSAPGRSRSTAAVRVYHPQRLEGTWHRRLPVTTVDRTLLDLAAVVSFDRLRRALAEAVFRNLVDLEQLAAAPRRGHPGSAALRLALARHRPELARTLSVLEERFLALCEQRGDIPIPEVNVRVCGLTVDALWRRERLIVELDGHSGHSTVAAMERDRGRELTLRSAGYSVLRYTWWQVTQQPERVAADLRAALATGTSEATSG
jgi:predicted transcriptional regulator of viral defense system